MVHRAEGLLTAGLLDRRPQTAEGLLGRGQWRVREPGEVHGVLLELGVLPGQGPTAERVDVGVARIREQRVEQLSADESAGAGDEGGEGRGHTRDVQHIPRPETIGSLA